MPSNNPPAGNGRFVSNYKDLIFDTPEKSTDIIGLEKKFNAILALAMAQSQKENPKNVDLGWTLYFGKEVNQKKELGKAFKEKVNRKHTTFAEDYASSKEKFHTPPTLHNLITAYTANTDFFRLFNNNSYTPAVTPQTFKYPASFLGLSKAMTMQGTFLTVASYVKDNAPLYRTVSNYPNIERQDETGKRFMLGAFSSFSLGFDFAKKSLDPWIANDATTFVLQNLFSNKRADNFYIYIAEHSVYPNQLEVLISPLMKFVIDKPPKYFDPDNPKKPGKKETPPNFVFISPSLPKN